MSSSLKGKTVLVTGGTSGIGRATARALAQAGANVVITGRRAEEGSAVAKELSGLGVKSRFVRGDISDEAHVKDAVDAAVALGGGRLDGAFNNAGLELAGVNTADATAEAYRRVFDTNVLGVLLSMKHQMRAMDGKGGSIVNNGSVAASIGMAGVGIYVASKHAVLGLTRSAAMEGAKAGIRVNLVSPAAIQTDMFTRFTGGPGTDAAAYLASLHPVGRVGRPEEVSAAVLFLLSDESSFITGHDLRVDGGFTAQ
ncbi:MAG: glucose 1-dehydrogenase [Phycisphaerae bacterium]|nr:glucose 1-dehydrogenase [Phycisphaerae bacterium]